MLLWKRATKVAPFIKHKKSVLNDDLGENELKVNDYVVATFANRNGKLSLSNFTNILSRVRTSNPYAKIIIVIFGNDSSYSLTKTFVTRAYNYGSVVDCSINSSCYKKFSSAGGFSSTYNLFFYYQFSSYFNLLSFSYFNVLVKLPLT